jgi:predicted metalloprotease with PDZ domain
VTGSNAALHISRDCQAALHSLCSDEAREPSLRCRKRKTVIPRNARRPEIHSIVLFIGLFLFAAPAHATISYTISLEHPDQHLFHVIMEVPVQGRELTTALPAWNALYQIRDFAERVRDVSAICPTLEAVPLTVRKTDKQDWQISSPNQCTPGDRNTFVVRYSILWNEPGPFDSQLNAHHAFLNLAEILMYVPSRRAENVKVQFENIPPGWQAAGALISGANSAYAAGSYDDLVDAPVEVGVFNKFNFESDGASISVVFDGKESNLLRLEKYLTQVTDYELHLMGGPPFDHHPAQSDYTFLVRIGPGGEVGGGGMEHRNSCAISASSAEEAGAIAAHEFFHAWNVKRIRPQSLEPVDYAREQYSRALWFAEGVTNTYEDYALERTGLWTKEMFYKDLAGQIDTLQSRPARLWQSAEQSSIDAWFEGFPDYADPDRSISYYSKGQILGVLLDIAIRDVTDNHKSLDDVMRLMNDEYAKQGKFYDDSEGVRRAVAEVSGKEFKDFFARYVSGTEEVPYNDFLSLAGLQLVPNPQRNAPPYSITEIPNPTDRQRRIRDGLLHGTSD